MGQFILFLLGLFAIGCMLYGISAGVQIIQRGFSWLAESARDGTPDKTPSITPLPQRPNKTAAESSESPATAQANTTAADASPMQHAIEELREIFALYQQGALTREEFEAMKQRLLNSFNTAAPQYH